jgi:hypothetical protein
LRVKLRKKKKEYSAEEYVLLNGGYFIRKTLLESAVDATTLLKRWESYKLIREKKLRYMKRLRLIMARIYREVISFKRHFPDIKEEKIERPKVRKERKKEAPAPIVKAKSELDREIDMIKAKLERLGAK